MYSQPGFFNVKKLEIVTIYSFNEIITRQIIKLFFAMIVTAVFFLAGETTCFATTVVLQWDAVTDPDLAGYKIYYQADSSVQPFTGTGATQGNSPIDVHSQTTATIGGLDPSHAYYFAVTAYYTSGVEMVSPFVTISSPAINDVVGGTVMVTADASDNVSVTKVEFYVNGKLKSTDISYPYLFSWNTSILASGTYTLSAKAYDAAGNVGQSNTVTVKVVKDLTPPTVELTSPINNATVSGTVSITAGASDNVGVSKVEYYLNNALLYATNVSPYNYFWDTTTLTNSSYSLYAKVYDTSNNVGQSANVDVTVSNIIYNQGNGGYYSSLQMAYDNASNGDTLFLLGVQINENIVCSQSKSVKLSGGYNQGFTLNNGYTALHGTYILGQGKLLMNRIVIN
jgi:chitinase